MEENQKPESEPVAESAQENESTVATVAPEQQLFKTLTEEEIEKLSSEGKFEKMDLDFNLIQPQSVVNQVALNPKTLCFCWVPDPEKPKKYAGLAVNNARVAAEIAKIFAEFSRALMDKEVSEMVKNAETPKKKLSLVKGFKGRLQ